MCPHHPHLLYLLHRAGWSGDAVAATSFTTAALIGTALALEVQAIASPAARLRKKSVLRMNVSPEVPLGNERRFPSVPRVQRGARLIRWVSHGEHIQRTPSFLRAGAVITRGPEPRLWQAVCEEGQGALDSTRREIKREYAAVRGRQHILLDHRLEVERMQSSWGRNVLSFPGLRQYRTWSSARTRSTA